MNKYCRYCAFCVYGDVPFCEIQNKTMSEEKIKKVNKCKDFLFNETDVINGGICKERKCDKEKYGKLSIEDLEILKEENND